MESVSSKKIKSICANCKNDFIYESYKLRKYCSTKCSNEARVGIVYDGSRLKDKASGKARMLVKIINDSNINHCMIDGCLYGKTLDIHRFVPGKVGGKYTHENTFLLCPNHHAEIHRGIIDVVEIGKHKLQISKHKASNQLEKYTQLINTAPSSSGKDS